MPGKKKPRLKQPGTLEFKINMPLKMFKRAAAKAKDFFEDNKSAYGRKLFMADLNTDEYGNERE